MSSIGQRFRSRIDAPRDLVWDCYLRDGMFERLTPPWLDVRTLARQGGVAPGDWRLLAIKAGPLALRWRATHREWQPGHLFTAEQGEGPFASWRHQHAFHEAGPQACILEDRVAYRLPGAQLSHWLGEPVARRAVWRMFASRHLVSRLDIERHFRYRDRPRLRIVVSGSPEDAVDSLSAFLSAGGHDVHRVAAARDASAQSARDAQIVLDGTGAARVWRATRPDSDTVMDESRTVRRDQPEAGRLMRLATGLHPVFGSPADACAWAVREALYSAIYHELMREERAGSAGQGDARPGAA